MKQTKLSVFFTKSSQTTPITSSITTTTNDKYVLFFDGCSKGNPGLAGSGAVLYKNNIEIWSDSFFVGYKITNNVSEYNGLINGLSHVSSMGIKNLTVKGDSELVINQMIGHYKVNSNNLLPSYNKAKELAKKFDKISFFHVYRNDNKRADELSNDGIRKTKF